MNQKCFGAQIQSVYYMQFVFAVIKPRNLYGSVALRTSNKMLEFINTVFTLFGNMTLDNDVNCVL